MENYKLIIINKAISKITREDQGIQPI